NEIRKRFIQLWKIEISGEGKLRTYSRFKKEFKQEKYLRVLNDFNLISNLAKLRTSSHTLNIERLRYTRPITPADQRMCPSCAQKIENEIHFV
ncbi:hypothetical protein, partial [Acinetobacter baumannii]|uniref:hypothetical protein n=1 Tax=Acinetobacter baumannii TaxID=470 RepID=UPI001C06D1C4